MTSYRLIGTSDECSKCDCCGRTISKAAVLTCSDSAFPDPSEVVYFGLGCAATTLQRQGSKGFKALKSKKEMIVAASSAATELKEAQKQELLNQGKVKNFAGFWLLPETIQMILDGLIDRNEAIAQRNKLYPCFLN